MKAIQRDSIINYYNTRFGKFYFRYVFFASIFDTFMGRHPWSELKHMLLQNPIIDNDIIIFAWELALQQRDREGYTYICRYNNKQHSLSLSSDETTAREGDGDGDGDDNVNEGWRPANA